MPPNIEVLIVDPSPVLERLIIASKIAIFEYIPAAMSHTDAPTRPITSGDPVTEISPLSP